MKNKWGERESEKLHAGLRRNSTDQVSIIEREKEY